MEHGSSNFIRSLERLIHSFEEQGRKEVDAEITEWAERWIAHLKKRRASALHLKIVRGGHMATTFTVDTITGAANLQFTDDHGDVVAGPVDSVTGAPVVPVVVSSDTSVLTAAAAAAGSTVGGFTAALVPLVEGSADISVAELTNSDGSPVLLADGVTPFPLPAAVTVTVTAGVAAALTLSVTA